MFHAITQGILFGLTLSLMIGPAFFKLIQTSISQGFRASSHLALGVSLSDILLVFVAWYGFSSFIEAPSAHTAVCVVGGLIIIGFGIYTATRRHVSHREGRSIVKVNISKFQYKSFTQGFVFNLVNPSTWLFWLIPVGMANMYPARNPHGINLQIVFLISILATNLSMDLMKCAAANELRRFLTDNVITIINRVVGGILILFGVYLLLCGILPPDSKFSVI